MVNIQILTNQIPINLKTISISEYTGKNIFVADINTKSKDSNGIITVVPKQKEFLLTKPKTLTERFNSLNKSVKLLKDIHKITNTKIEVVSNKDNKKTLKKNPIIRTIINKKITNFSNKISDKNIFKSYVLSRTRVSIIKEKVAKKEAVFNLFDFGNKKNPHKLNEKFGFNTGYVYDFNLRTLVKADNQNKVNKVNKSKKSSIKKIRINKNYYFLINLNYKNHKLTSVRNPILHILKYSNKIKNKYSLLTYEGYTFNKSNINDNRYNLNLNNNNNIVNTNSNNSNNSNTRILSQISNLFLTTPMDLKNRKIDGPKVFMSAEAKKLEELKLQLKLKKRQTSLIIKLRRFINIITKFYPALANNQSIFYNFYKPNNLVTHPFINASNILKLAFLSMGCLISRPVFKVVYTNNNLSDKINYKFKPHRKIIIQLFYFVRYRPNLSPLRNLLIKLFAKPHILDKGYKVHSKLNRKDLYYLKHRDNNYINKFNLIRALTKIKNYTRNRGFFSKYASKFQSLATYLTNLFGSEVQLDLVRLYRPHFDSNILVQDLNLKSYKNRFFGVVTKLFKKTYIKHRLTTILTGDNPLKPLTPLSNAYLTGVKVRLGGRSFQQRIVARKTVQDIQRGSLSKTNCKYKQRARFTAKVKRGSYSFTVTLGHTF